MSRSVVQCVVQRTIPPRTAASCATGFLTESRVAWAQTGNGLLGVHPVGRFLLLAGCAPIKLCLGRVREGRSPSRARRSRAGFLLLLILQELTAPAPGVLEFAAYPDGTFEHESLTS
jgi:hypothetical protein